MKSLSRSVAKFVVATSLMVGAATTPALSQTSSPTVRFIFPLAPGGSGDGLTRLLADRMRAEHGLTVVVENRAGGASRIGLLATKMAPPDGTTLLLTQMAPLTLFPHVYKTLDYDPVKDFTPVAQAATFEFGLAVNASIPVKTPAQLLAWLKANPDKAMFAGPGSGGLPHFFGLLVGREAGVEMTHVPYKGTANGITDLLSGQVPMMVALASDLAPLHRDGRIRVIATTDKERFPGLPDVPTFKESGIDIVGTGWFGVYAPPNTPPAIVDRFNKIIVAILQSAKVKERITSLGLKPTGSSPAELAAIQQADSGKWAPVIKASGFSFD